MSAPAIEIEGGVDIAVCLPFFPPTCRDEPQRDDPAVELVVRQDVDVGFCGGWGLGRASCISFCLFRFSLNVTSPQCLLCFDIGVMFPFCSSLFCQQTEAPYSNGLFDIYYSAGSPARLISCLSREVGFTSRPASISCSVKAAMRISFALVRSRS